MMINPEKPKIFKARKQGNSIAISIAKEANVKVGTKYAFSVRDNGELVYTPVEETNPWKNGSFDNIDFKKEVESLGFDDYDMKPVGNERWWENEDHTNEK